MKKILILLTSITLLGGCAETIALLGPASSLIGGGNVVQSTVSSAVSYGVKKQTGKSPMQHALGYAEVKNPNKKKDRCIGFVKKTESEVCYIAKKQISSTKKATVKKIKGAITSSKNKVVKKIKSSQKISTQSENKKLIAKKTDSKKVIVEKIESKKLIVKKIKVEKEIQLKSVESMLVKSAFNKKQISHLRVSIEKKNSRVKNSSK
jgi:hypothetical protein